MQIKLNKQNLSFWIIETEKNHLKQYASLFIFDVIMTHEKSGGKLHEPLALTADGGELSDSRSGLFNS
jgi:hypothetical protein